LLKGHALFPFKPTGFEIVVDGSAIVEKFSGPEGPKGTLLVIFLLTNGPEGQRGTLLVIFLLKPLSVSTCLDRLSIVSPPALPQG
jgi:hypothetical protein